MNNPKKIVPYPKADGIGFDVFNYPCFDKLVRYDYAQHYREKADQPKGQSGNSGFYSFICFHF
jgi:hypothetical protein